METKGFRFLLHGAEIHSDLDLGITPCDERSPVDLRLHIEQESVRVSVKDPVWRSRYLTREGEPTVQVAHVDDHLVMDLPGIGQLLMRDTRMAVVSGGTRSLVPFILGRGLALWLEQLGIVVLHASCVNSPWGAICFAGPPGVGKSTFAATCVHAGWPLLGDDVAPLFPAKEGMTVFPGHGEIRLWPDSARAAGVDISRAPRVHQSMEKRRIQFKNARSDACDRVSLRAVFFLQRMTSTQMQDMTARVINPARSLAWLIGASHVAAALQALGLHRQRMQILAPLAASASCFALQFPRSLDHMDALIPELTRVLSGTATGQQGEPHGTDA